MKKIETVIVMALGAVALVLMAPPGCAIPPTEAAPSPPAHNDRKPWYSMHCAEANGGFSVWMGEYDGDLSEIRESIGCPALPQDLLDRLMAYEDD